MIPVEELTVVGDKPESTLEEILRQDHDEIEELWESAVQLRGSDPAGSRKKYLLFVEALDEHIEIEENFLYPYSLRTHGDNVGHLVAMMREEHVEIRKRLGNIRAAANSGQPPSEADETELRNTLGTHNAREEGLYYPEFDRIFSTTPEGKKLTQSVLHQCSCGKR